MASAIDTSTFIEGALLEKYFNAYDLSVEETEKLLATYANFVKRK